jgi:hypothetical protein
MKNKILLAAIFFGVSQLACGQENKFVATKNKLSGTGLLPSGQKAPDAEFRIKSIPPGKTLPDLVIPTYSTFCSRVVDVRYSNNRVEVVVQNDEFGMNYSDYKLVGEEWVLQGQKSVCSLNGNLALKLAQVNILEGGIVEVKYHEESSVSGKSGWNNELINKDHKHNEKLLSERYALKKDGFVIDGEPVRLRPKTDKPKAVQEPQKPQPPAGGETVPEKLKE